MSTNLKQYINKLYRWVLVLFFVIVFAVPIFWLTRGKSTAEVSVIEARTLAAMPAKSFPNLKLGLELIKQGELFEGAKIFYGLLTNSSFVQKVENATSDQFPLRMPAIAFSKAIDRSIVNFAYSFTADEITPADVTTNIYYDRKDQQLIFSPSIFDENEKEQIDLRISNYQEIIETYPEMSFYLFYHQTLRYSPHHPLNDIFENADKGQALTYFEKSIPLGLAFEKFVLANYEDHLKYYYRTDHHWNIYGILKAYDKIYDLISKDYVNISPKQQYKKIVSFPEIEYLGNNARQTFYPIKGDLFEVAQFDLASYKLVEDGNEVDFDRTEKYISGNYSKIKYTDHYNAYYGDVPAGLIEYTFDNVSERNLLLFGSSYSAPLQPLLASHYKQTFCVDLRYYTNFSMSEFISKHDIDDVLIIGDNPVAFQDVEYWLITP